MLTNSILGICALLIAANLYAVVVEAATIKQNTVRKFFFRLQPELDVIDLDSFVRKDLVLKFQLKCLLNNDTFCDAVGRWLAPRIPYILMDGKCPKCTPIQEQKIAKALAYVQEQRPELYKALWERYFEEEDENVSISNQVPKNIATSVQSEVTENTLRLQQVTQVNNVANE